MLSKKEPELEDVGNSPHIHFAKNKKVYSGKKVWLGSHPIKGYGVTHRSNQHLSRNAGSLEARQGCQTSVNLSVSLETGAKTDSAPDLNPNGTKSFGLAWCPFPLSDFPPLECECLSYVCISTVFQKQVTGLISQAHSTEGCQHRMNHTPSLNLT